MNLHIRQATPDDLPQVQALYAPTLFTSRWALSATATVF
jgi:hypothetical protein